METYSELENKTEAIINNKLGRHKVKTIKPYLDKFSNYNVRATRSFLVFLSNKSEKANRYIELLAIRQQIKHRIETTKNDIVYFEAKRELVKIGSELRAIRNKKYDHDIKAYDNIRHIANKLMPTQKDAIQQQLSHAISGYSPLHITIKINDAVEDYQRDHAIPISDVVSEHEDGLAIARMLREVFVMCDNKECDVCRN